LLREVVVLLREVVVLLWEARQPFANSALQKRDRDF